MITEKDESVGKVFGVPLADVVASPGNKGEEIPLIVSSCITFLRERSTYLYVERLIAVGLTIKGIMRLSGVHDEILQLRQAFDQGLLPSLDKVQDSHSIAGLLKYSLLAGLFYIFRLYLRELPEPLLTYANYEVLLDVSGTLHF